ncbi:MAG: VOC family protein [Nitriliruptorales bacterium]|nr:VOC family protein [Nitriliruptorales bacterium]
MGSDRITARAFHEREGVEDWRLLYGGAYVHYLVESFSQGAQFIAAIAEIADELDHHPTVDLRAEGVTVRTFMRETGAVGELDVQLAQRISVAAKAMGLRADPARLQVVGIAVAQDAEADVLPFWSAALGYTQLRRDLSADPQRRNPHLWFHELRPSKPGRGRLHIDVCVPADQAEARVAEALAAGGRLADDSFAPQWWTLASPENHGVDIVAHPDIEDGPY